MERVRRLELTVNGEVRSVAVSADSVLLDILREQFGLRGTKKGCGRGECGACTVLVDGRPVASCVYPSDKAEGRCVETVEGLSLRVPRGRLHPLQESFIKLGAVQCGFCTPGMLMSAAGLLDSNPAPTRNEIREAIAGNLCRCTGYTKLVDAIEAAAAGLREGISAPTGVPPQTRPGVVSTAEPGTRGPRQCGLGLPSVKLDAEAKVTGTAMYAADVNMQGQLHAAMVTSPYPHARLVAIDASRALGLPGVVAVLTHADIPGEIEYGVISKDQPFLPRDRVRYEGEPVAIVLAETERIAREAVKAVRVTYTPLPAVFTPEDAMDEQAPLLFASRPRNILFHRRIARGDVDTALGSADVVASRTFITQAVEHAYLEPEAALAYWDDRVLVVHSGCQSPHYVQAEISRMLALSPDRVRVVQTTTGGAFGGKVDLSVQHFAALGAYVTKRPVKMVWTRAESMRTSTKRHGHRLSYQVGADREGRLVGADINIVSNTGAYASFGGVVITRSCLHALGPYECPNVRVNGYAVHTNMQVAGAMRGFGVPQVAVCHEAVMDELARRCGLSPQEMRRRNMVQPGGSTLTGQRLGLGVGSLVTLSSLEEAIGAREAARIRDGASSISSVGLACVFYGNGTTAKPEPSAATVSLSSDGKLTVCSTATELGQGLDIAFAQLAAETLGVAVDSVTVLPTDTAVCVEPGAGWSPGQTYVLGNAVCLAAGLLRDKLTEGAASMLRVDVGSLSLREGFVWADGRKMMTVAEVCESLQGEGIPLSAHASFTPDISDGLDPETGEGRPYGAYSYAGQAMEVEVDPATGEYHVEWAMAAQDVGRIINPLTTEAQVQGAVAMGVGYGMLEQLVWSDGHLVTDGFDTYLLPTAMDLPDAEVRLLEVREPSGPFGAKAVGEPAACPTAAALVNAIERATGVRLESLPVSAETLYWKLHDVRNSDAGLI